MLTKYIGQSVAVHTSERAAAWCGELTAVSYSTGEVELDTAGEMRVIRMSVIECVLVLLPEGGAE